MELKVKEKDISFSQNKSDDLKLELERQRRLMKEVAENNRQENVRKFTHSSSIDESHIFIPLIVESIKM